jgi:hypothetical protein
MEGLLDLLAKYWIVPVVAVVIGGPAVFSFIKQKAGSLRLPKLPSFKFGKNKTVETVDLDSLVDKDIEAIQWLANRAVDVNDEQLILELENVNKKFFHIHRNMRKPVVGPVSAE